MSAHKRTITWKGRWAFGGYKVVVKAKDSNGNVDPRFSYEQRVKVAQFVLPLDAGFGYEVSVQPMISSGLVSAPTQVFNSTSSRELPKAIMNADEEEEFKKRLADSKDSYNVLLVGAVKAGKSMVVNRIVQALSGVKATIAPAGDNDTTLTPYLIRYAGAKNLNLFDWRGFQLQGERVQEAFGTYLAEFEHVLAGQMEPHMYVGRVLQKGNVDEKKNRIDGVIFVKDMSADFRRAVNAEENQGTLMNAVGRCGRQHIVVNTRLDKCNVDRLPNVNLAATPEDGLRLSELAATVEKETTYPIAQFVGDVNGDENAQHRRMVLTALRALLDSIDANSNALPQAQN